MDFYIYIYIYVNIGANPIVNIGYYILKILNHIESSKTDKDLNAWGILSNYNPIPRFPVLFVPRDHGGCDAIFAMRPLG